MKISESAAPPVMGQVEKAVSRPRRAETSVLRCLVVSASQTRRNMLYNAASTAGWDTLVCAETQLAMVEFQRRVCQFALVDLDLRGQTPEGFRALVQTVAADSSRILVAVCGHEADPAEEVWVRQLGIWLYLPGVTNSSEISLLCEQALLVVEKQRKDVKTPVM